MLSVRSATYFLKPSFTTHVKHTVNFDTLRVMSMTFHDSTIILPNLLTLQKILKVHDTLLCSKDIRVDDNLKRLTKISTI